MFIRIRFYLENLFIVLSSPLQNHRSFSLKNLFIWCNVTFILNAFSMYGRDGSMAKKRFGVTFSARSDHRCRQPRRRIDARWRKFDGRHLPVHFLNYINNNSSNGNFVSTKGESESETLPTSLMFQPKSWPRTTHPLVPFQRTGRRRPSNTGPKGTNTNAL